MHKSCGGCYALVEGEEKGGEEGENKCVLQTSSQKWLGHLAAALTFMKWHHMLFLQSDAAGASCCCPHLHERSHILFQQSDAGGASRCSPHFREMVS